MTTIAYKEGILAADNQISQGHHKWATMPKLFGTLRSNVMAGVAGRLSDIALFRGWVNTLRPQLGCDYTNNFIIDGPSSPHANTDNPPEGLLIMRNGAIFYWDGTPSLVEIEPRTWHMNSDSKIPYIAIGSGTEFALAAMSKGSTSIEAVLLSASLQGTVNEADIVALSFADMDLNQRANGMTDHGMHTKCKALIPMTYTWPPEKFPPKPEGDPPSDSNVSYLKSKPTKSPKPKPLKH